LPGHAENEPWRPFQHLEKRYFETGNLGFPVTDAFGGKMGMRDGPANLDSAISGLSA
jgi:hypothetical protein